MSVRKRTPIRQRNRTGCLVWLALLLVVPVVGCAEGQSFGDWWTSSDDVEALQTVADDVAADSLALEIQLNEWRREAARFEEAVMTAEEEAYYDWIKDQMKAGDGQMEDLATSTGNVAAAISKATTNGDLVLMGGLEIATLLGGGFWIKRLAGPAAAFTKLVGNISGAARDRADRDDPIVLDHNSFKALNKASGIQPLIEKITRPT